MADLLVFLPICALSFLLGRQASELLGAGCCAVIVVAGTAIDPELVVVLLLVTGVPWGGGAAIRSRERILEPLGRRTQELEAEQDALARLSVQRERARIARELHDIVAHHLAVIVVQAGAGRIAPSAPKDAAERFARIRQSGEEALADMERLVDLLQAEEEEGEGHRIEVLVDQAEAAGLKLRASAAPPDVELSPDAERLAYRIVQEGLTNAMKHAPGSDVRLKITAGGDLLEIVLVNWGGEAPSSLAASGSGLGLRGLRERLEALGGRLEAAPEGGGWRLRAAIPIR